MCFFESLIQFIFADGVELFIFFETTRTVVVRRLSFTNSFLILRRDSYEMWDILLLISNFLSECIDVDDIAIIHVVKTRRTRVRKCGCVIFFLSS